MTVLKTVLAVLAVAALASPAMAGDFSSCGSSSDIYQVSSVTSTTPAKGATVTITTEGTLSAGVDGGSVTMTTWFDGVQVQKKSGEFCASVEKTSPCPWKAGDKEIKFTNTLASSLPTGSYQVQTVAVDPNGKQILCIKGSFSLS
eukprot:TRINITY_DN66739_c10_g1_i1.p2 TRINITY_DN66739_c10_g1~~TRINITY_DN66739_c10_g1_i1.p2  ORF type:complete len:165 (+),score=76.24 TRINITY_DN66739_c10_g1_i1:63-497(+)